MEKFPGKKPSLLERTTAYLKEKKKKAVVYGSIVATLGGIAASQQAYGQETPIDANLFKKIDMRNEYRGTDQDSLGSESAFHARMETFQKNPNMILDGSADSLEKQRTWVLEKMDDPAYLLRATKYEGLSPEDIEKRKEYLKNSVVVFIDGDKIRSTAVGDAEGHTYGYRDRAVIAIATKSKNTKEGNPTLVHESVHARPIMSVYAYNLYLNAFFHLEDSISVSDNKTYGTPEWGFGETDNETKEQLTRYQNYMDQAEELDANKNAFEYEIENLGIRKYGEEFTDETLEKVTQAIREGKLTDDSVEFFTHVNPANHGEWIKLIMNTIA